MKSVYGVHLAAGFLVVQLQPQGHGINARPGCNFIEHQFLGESTLRAAGSAKGSRGPAVQSDVLVILLDLAELET